MTGEQITSLKKLCDAAKERKSVMIISGTRETAKYSIIPAAFVQNMQGFRIQKLFDNGMYIYIKENLEEK